MTRRFGTVAVVLLAMLLDGCISTERVVDRHMAVCLEDAAGVSAFRVEMERLATEHGIQFFDGSASTQESDAALGVSTDYAIVHFAASREDGFRFGVLSLAVFEVGLAFTYGSDVEASVLLTNGFVDRLERQWVIREVPLDVGISPSKNCPSSLVAEQVTP